MSPGRERGDRAANRYGRNHDLTECGWKLLFPWNSHEVLQRGRRGWNKTVVPLIDSGPECGILAGGLVKRPATVAPTSPGASPDDRPCPVPVELPRGQRVASRLGWSSDGVVGAWFAGLPVATLCVRLIRRTAEGQQEAAEARGVAVPA